jgi:hypothetical protein
MRRSPSNHRKLDALGERALLPHEHALEAAGAGENAGERCRHREFHQQDD